MLHTCHMQLLSESTVQAELVGYQASKCKRSALMGSETITDVCYYDVKQWNVHIGAVKVTRIVLADVGMITRGHDIAISNSVAICFDLSNNLENFSSASLRQSRSTASRLSTC